MLAEFIFSSPLMLIGLLFALIPLILHLFGKTRAQTIKFPMMRFVKQAALKTYHRRRIENLALLLARMALFGFVPIALALPFYRSRHLRFAQSGNIALAIIIDNTSSMNQKANGKKGKSNARQENSAFEIAKIEALRLLRGSEQFPAPNLEIVITPVGKLALTPLTSTDITRLATQIRSLKCSDAETDIAMSIVQAYKLLEAQPYANKLIYVISDCQKNEFDIKGLTILNKGNIPIVILKTIEDMSEPENIGISDVQISSPIIAGKLATITARVSGHLSSDKNLKLKIVDANGKSLALENIIVEGYKGKGFSKSYSLKFAPTRKQYFSGRIELGISDKLANDNKYYLAFGITKPLKVLVVSNSNKHEKWDNDPAFFVMSALQASGWIEPKRVSISQLPQNLNDDIRALYLCEPTKYSNKTNEALMKYLQSGNKNVIIFPNLKKNKVISTILKQFEIGNIVQIVKTDTPYYVTEIDSADRLIMLLGIRTSVYSKIAIGSYAQISVSNTSDVLLNLSNSHPLLIRKSLFGSNVYLFTSPARVEAGTFPLNAVFPALMCNIVAQAVSQTQNYAFRAGKSFSVKTSKAIKMLDSSGTVVQTLKAGQNECILYHSGLYALEGEHPIAINCASETSEILAWKTDELNKKFSGTPKGKLLFASCSSVDIEKHLLALAKGKPIWDYILFAAIIIMLIETFLANLHKPLSESTKANANIS